VHHVKTPLKEMRCANKAVASPSGPARSMFASEMPNRTVQALPAFSHPNMILREDKDPLETTRTPTGPKQLAALDADSLNESSARLRALVFDVLKCLDDSTNTSQAPPIVNRQQENQPHASPANHANRTSNGECQNGNSPNTKARGWGEWHPCSTITPKTNIVSPAAVDTNAFFRFF